MWRKLEKKRKAKKPVESWRMYKLSVKIRLFLLVLRQSSMRRGRDMQSIWRHQMCTRIEQQTFDMIFCGSRNLYLGRLPIRCFRSFSVDTTIALGKRTMWWGLGHGRLWIMRKWQIDAITESLLVISFGKSYWITILYVVVWLVKQRSFQLSWHERFCGDVNAAIEFS